MHAHLPPGITLVQADNLDTWLMDIRVLDDNPIYRNQTYRLKFVFSGSYPIGMFRFVMGLRGTLRSERAAGLNLELDLELDLRLDLRRAAGLPAGLGAGSGTVLKFGVEIGWELSAERPLRLYSKLPPPLPLRSPSVPAVHASHPSQASPNPISQKHTAQLTTRTEAPEVTFVKTESHPIPMHPHIYSNGIICLDLLDRQGWSPVHNVESVCMSLQSMLTGNTKNERPEGDEAFVRNNRLRPRDVSFYFHDNTV